MLLTLFCLDICYLHHACYRLLKPLKQNPANPSRPTYHISEDPVPETKRKTGFKLIENIPNYSISVKWCCVRRLEKLSIVRLECMIFWHVLHWVELHIALASWWARWRPKSPVYSTVYSGAAERKHQSSASLAFVQVIHRWPINSLTNGQWRGKCFHSMTSSW